MNCFSPAEIASNYIATGKSKVSMSIGKMLLSGILAGMFIAFGAIASTTAAVSIPLSSVAKLVGACLFPGGLTMVLLAGSELFTGNCLLTIPLLQREIRFRQMLRNWVFVYLGNFIGGLFVAAAVSYGHCLNLFDNALAVSTISTAAAKCSLSFGDALIKGILCNILVCIAVWISFAAKDVAGKIAGLFFPIMIFVLCGFEHCIANMYYISAGLFANTIPAYANACTACGIDTSYLTIGNFLTANLLPVTLGNIIGGALLIGGFYWLLYLKEKKHNF